MFDFGLQLFTVEHRKSRLTMMDLPEDRQNTDQGLRARKKQEVRKRILAQAHRLFHMKGFDATTVEEICKASEISKRTLFRYFDDKEALVFPNREERLCFFISFLNVHLDADDPYQALRDATTAFGRWHMDKREKIQAQKFLIRSSSALRAREAEIDADWEKAITDAFVRADTTLADNSMWASIQAGAIMGVVRATVNHWIDSGCTKNLETLGFEAINRLERGFKSE